MSSLVVIVVYVGLSETYLVTESETWQKNIMKQKAYDPYSIIFFHDISSLQLVTEGIGIIPMIFYLSFIDAIQSGMCTD